MILSKEDLTFIEKTKKKLNKFYSETGPELVGFVSAKGKVSPVTNVSPDPDEGFMVSAADIEFYTEVTPSKATWHTHPGETSNLSGEDYKTFMVWDDMIHFIIGKDGVTAYYFDDEAKGILQV